MAVKKPKRPSDRPQGDQRPRERGRTRARRRQEREEERTTLGDEVTQEGNIRYEGEDMFHGPQPPPAELPSEPLWTDPTRKSPSARRRRDQREGVIREGTFQHIPKEHAVSHEPEDEVDEE